MSFSGADPDALADYAAQAIDAADSLRPIDERLATVEALLKRAVPHPPSVHGAVDGFARFGRRTRELGERVGTFGRRLRDALGGPSSTVPMTMRGLLFPGQATSPPRPVGWERWSAKDRARYLREADPTIAGIKTVKPTAVGRLAKVAGQGLVNGVVGEVDGVLNTVSFGLAPDLAPAFRKGDAAAGFDVGRWSGTIATGVAAPEAIGDLAPSVGARTATGFVARRGVDAAVAAATEASVDRHATAGSMATAGLTGGVLGGILEGGGQTFAAWRIAHVDVPTISHGFDSIADWQAFSAKLHDGLAAAGYPEARGAVQGSAATGRSFVGGEPFDLGRVSDLDVAIAGDRMLADAAERIKLWSKGMRTPPVSPKLQRQLGVDELLAVLSADLDRPVHIMIYRSLDEAIGHKPSIPLPIKRS